MNKPDFYKYIALLDSEKDGIHVTFPDLPGCVTFGQDNEEAIGEASKTFGAWRTMETPRQSLQLSRTCPTVKS